MAGPTKKRMKEKNREKKKVSGSQGTQNLGYDSGEVVGGYTKEKAENAGPAASPPVPPSLVARRRNHRWRATKTNNAYQSSLVRSTKTRLPTPRSYVGKKKKEGTGPHGYAAPTSLTHPRQS